MGWIIRPFECLSSECGHSWEDIVPREEENSQQCPKCGHEARWVISVTGIAVFSMMSKDDQAKCLRKRSREHTMKELKKDPTQIRQTRHKLK